MICNGYISEINIAWQFRFPDTEHYLRKFICCSEKTGSGHNPSLKTVSVSEFEFADWERAGNAIDAFAEFCLLCQQTSEYLLLNDSCIFHAVALSFCGRAWLIAAGSGAGKTTLCKSLLEAFPQEIEVINGDKPALRFDEDFGVMAHPSPWNGKEGICGAAKAPLAGVFLLRRGDENRITVAKEPEAAARVYGSIFQSFQDESIMRASGKMTEHILKSGPVWSLVSKDVPSTTKLVYQTMREELNCELQD